MQNPLLKSQLIENNDFAYYSKYLFINNLNNIDKCYDFRPLAPDLSNLLDENIAFLSAELNYTDVELKSLKQLFDSRRQKVLRLKKRIKFMCEYSQYVYFLTLTWSDEVLNNTSEETRRTYVNRFLSSQDYCDYYANIDFGSNTEREHYHCIIALNSDTLSAWSYGFSFYEVVRVSDKSSTRLSSYILKLTYHAYKDSTKQKLNRAISPKQKNYKLLEYFSPVRGDLVF